MKICFSICLSLILLSCVDNRNIELDDFEKQLVLNSIVSTDSIWNVQLSYTKSIFDEGDFDWVQSAEVRVVSMTNGQSFFLNEKTPGQYSRELVPVEGHEYKITVNVPDKEELRAQTYVPSVLNVDVRSLSSIDSNGQEQLEISLQITDNPDEENYYVWEIVPVTRAQLEQEESTNEESEQEFSEIHIQVSNPVENSEESQTVNEEIYTHETFITEKATGENDNLKSLNTLSFISDTDINDDGTISNKIILDQSLFSGLGNDGNGEELSENDSPARFQLNVMVVSSDLYEYLQSYEVYKRSDIKNTSLSDPTTIYSNIENGLGIFGGYNLKTFELR